MLKRVSRFTSKLGSWSKFWNCVQERFVKRRQHLLGPNSSTLKVCIVGSSPPPKERKTKRKKTEERKNNNVQPIGWHGMLLDVSLNYFWVAYWPYDIMRCRHSKYWRAAIFSFRWLLLFFVNLYFNLPLFFVPPTH